MIHFKWYLVSNYSEGSPITEVIHRTLEKTETRALGFTFFSSLFALVRMEEEFQEQNDDDSNEEMEVESKTSNKEMEVEIKAPERKNFENLPWVFHFVD